MPRKTLRKRDERAWVVIPPGTLVTCFDPVNGIATHRTVLVVATSPGGNRVQVLHEGVLTIVNRWALRQA